MIRGHFPVFPDQHIPYVIFTLYLACSVCQVSRVDFLPMVHADCKLHRANRRRYQAAKQPQLNRM